MLVAQTSNAGVSVIDADAFAPGDHAVRNPGGLSFDTSGQQEDSRAWPEETSIEAFRLSLPLRVVKRLAEQLPASTIGVAFTAAAPTSHEG